VDRVEQAQTTNIDYDKDERTTRTADASGTTQTSYDGVGRVAGGLHPGAMQPDTSRYDLSNRVTTTSNGAGATLGNSDI